MKTNMNEELNREELQEVAGGKHPPLFPSHTMRDFVRHCKENGMTKDETIRAVEIKYHCGPEEAKAVVNEFWN